MCMCVCARIYVPEHMFRKLEDILQESAVSQFTMLACGLTLELHTWLKELYVLSSDWNVNSGLTEALLLVAVRSI